MSDLYDAPEAPGLLEACKEDGPGLVLADWLEGHGDGARAELVRLRRRLDLLHDNWRGG